MEHLATVMKVSILTNIVSVVPNEMGYILLLSRESRCYRFHVSRDKGEIIGTLVCHNQTRWYCPSKSQRVSFEGTDGSGLQNSRI